MISEHQQIYAKIFEMVSNEGIIGHSQPQSHYQHIVVKGLPYDRGFSHGTQVTEKIRFNVDYYKRPGKLPSRFV